MFDSLYKHLKLMFIFDIIYRILGRAIIRTVKQTDIWIDGWTKTDEKWIDLPSKCLTASTNISS